ncbi:MAG: ABC transporter substrate-binding protein [Burkholderiales bacterium]
MGGALAAPLARARKPTEPRTIGFLSPHPPLPPEHPVARAVLAVYQRHGWTLGETLRIERPNAEGREERLRALAEELVRKRVEVIWALGPEAAIAAARATRTIPIVFWGVAWPIEQGPIESFARPGRSATGIAFTAGSEGEKVLETMREIAPKAVRLAQIATPSALRTVGGDLFQGTLPSLQVAAKRLGFEMRRIEIARVEDIEGAFAAVRESRAQALYVPGTTLTFRERGRFVDFANQNGLPSGFNQFEFVDAGGPFSYGIGSMQTILQTFEYVDRILRGAKPAELPVQLPQRFQPVLNRKTALALGLALPQSLLVRADRAIE